jgi:hypothetical protein
MFAIVRNSSTVRGGREVQVSQFPQTSERAYNSFMPEISFEQQNRDHM